MCGKLVKRRFPLIFTFNLPKLGQILAYDKKFKIVGKKMDNALALSVL